MVKVYYLGKLFNILGVHNLQCGAGPMLNSSQACSLAFPFAEEEEEKNDKFVINNVKS